MRNKAVSTQDIHNSLHDGRLLNQITMMTKYYSQIILLLEFDESIKFKLKDRYDSLSDSLNVDSSSVFSKLSLLQLNFPTLTILWSRSPKETAKIFQKLKRNSGNPNLDEIMKIGKLECSKDSISSELRDLAETDVGTSNFEYITIYSWKIR